MKDDRKTEKQQGIAELIETARNLARDTTFYMDQTLRLLESIGRMAKPNPLSLTMQNFQKDLEKMLDKYAPERND